MRVLAEADGGRGESAEGGKQVRQNKREPRYKPPVCCWLVVGALAALNIAHISLFGRTARWR